MMTQVIIKFKIFTSDFLFQDEQQQIPCHSLEERPQIRNKYSQNMNYNDVSNSAALDGMAKTRKRDWSSAVMMWLLPMITCVNRKKFYESAIGQAVENACW